MYGNGVVQGSYLRPTTGGHRNQSPRWYIVGLAHLGGQYAKVSGTPPLPLDPNEDDYGHQIDVAGRDISSAKGEWRGQCEGGGGDGGDGRAVFIDRKAMYPSCLHVTVGNDCYHSGRKFKKRSYTNMKTKRKLLLGIGKTDMTRICSWLW